MNVTILSTVRKEKDIGVIVNKDLKPSLQCAEAAQRASAVLTQISRAFLYRERHVFLKLYIQFVRCHMEFAVSAWCPWTVQDVEVFEKVQKKAINLINGLQGMTYDEKLVELGITSLKARRTRIDLVPKFKMLKGIDTVDFNTWFSTVGHEVKRVTRHTSYHRNLVPKRSSTEMRTNFFSNRVVKHWNSLPIEIREAKNVKKFAELLDGHLSLQQHPLLDDYETWVGKM